MKKTTFHSSYDIRKRNQFRLLLLLAACLFLSLEIGWLTQKNRAAVSSEAEEERVLSAELAGYLQIIPFSPAETRAWLLPSMDTYLTGSDVDEILSFLELDSYAETLHEQIPYEEKEAITRQKWCLLYESLIEYLGLSDEVNVVSIRYLGLVPGESRLISDSGNYDCDVESIDFTYGETYEVYICGNILLGIKADTEETGTESQDADAQDLSAEPVIPETVRVLLTQDNHQSVYRTTVILKGSTALHLSDGDREYAVNADAAVDCTDLMAQWGAEQLTAEAEDGGRICIANAEGSAVSSYYRGRLYLYQDDSGVWIVNELGLEEYLYGVVPGEMPESFAAEALQAQAVCARTYVCRKTAAGSYAAFQADVNDTTDCQVYLPSKENEAAIQAVDATAGQVLAYQGMLASVYYFSTSCGYTSGPEVWQSDAIDYLTGVSMLTEAWDGADFDAFLRDTEVAAYDSGSRYFRWSAELSPLSGQETLKQVISEELAKSTGKIAITDAGRASASDTDEASASDTGEASVSDTDEASASDTDGASASDTDGASVTDTGGVVAADTALLGDYENMTVLQRNESGTVTDLQIQFTNASVHIYHENTIRTILGAVMTGLTDKNGDLVYTFSILPSAAISIESSGDGTCRIYGGGLGHGIGMSQYGANGMAEAGKTCEEILQIFFPGTEIISRS